MLLCLRGLHMKYNMICVIEIFLNRTYEACTGFRGTPVKCEKRAQIFNVSDAES